MRLVQAGVANDTLRRQRVVCADRKVAARGRLRLARLLAFAALLCVAAAQPVPAQGPGFLQLPDAKTGVPLLIQADEMIYDYDLDQVTASGNVEIYYAKYALTADRVIYDKRHDKVTAYGKVRLREPDGNVLFGDSLTLTGDFREGFVRSLSVLTPENARIAAATAQRREGNLVIFNRAVYTACQINPDTPEKAPIWQIKAVKIVHNQAEKTIEYDDVTFELAGVPIAYLPHFSHPDPSVKRKSGFLTPLFRVSTQLGASVEVPYFWALAPDYDLTFSPRVTSKQGILAKAEWRQRLINGSYYIRAAGISQLDPNALPAPGNKRLRGAVQSAGTFRINEFWTTGWNITAASDDTFLRVYDLDEDTEQVSSLFLTGLSDRNYFDLRAMHLRNYASPPTFVDPAGTLPFGTPIDPSTGTAFLVGGVPLPPPDQPLVHPVLDYNYLFDRSVMGGQLGFNLHAYSLTRDVGTDSSRVVADVEWRRTFTDSHGQQFTPFFDLRGDIYQVNDVFDATVLPGGLRGEETVTRGMAAAGINYSFPFISTHSWGNQVIEPIAQVIFRPDEQNRNQISNEDAQSLVFDDTVLFDTDKFSGFDRVEGGTRANIGVRYTVQTNDWGYGTVLLGQSFQLAGANPFDPTTGLGGDSSDIVGAVFLEPGTNFGLATQFRLDRDSFDIRRHDLKSWARTGPIFASVTYSKHMQAPTPGVISDREEILTSGSLDLTNNWRLFGHFRYDISGGTRVQSGVGLGYFCDCATIRVDYSEDYFRDRDDKPNRTVSLFIDLKTLGSTTVSAGSTTLPRTY